jgi:hypothetical protein
MLMLSCCRDAKEAEAKAAAESAAAESKKQTRKQAKNFALMSFGEPRRCPPARPTGLQV